MKIRLYTITLVTLAGILFSCSENKDTTSDSSDSLKNDSSQTSTGNEATNDGIVDYTKIYPTETTSLEEIKKSMVGYKWKAIHAGLKSNHAKAEDKIVWDNHLNEEFQKFRNPLEDTKTLEWEFHANNKLIQRGRQYAACDKHFYDFENIDHKNNPGKFIKTICEVDNMKFGSDHPIIGANDSLAVFSLGKTMLPDVELFVLMKKETLLQQQK